MRQNYRSIMSAASEGAIIIYSRWQETLESQGILYPDLPETLPSGRIFRTRSQWNAEALWAWDEFPIWLHERTAFLSLHFFSRFLLSLDLNDSGARGIFTDKSPRRIRSEVPLNGGNVGSWQVLRRRRDNSVVAGDWRDSSGRGQWTADRRMIQ